MVDVPVKRACLLRIRNEIACPVVEFVNFFVCLIVDVNFMSDRKMPNGMEGEAMHWELDRRQNRIVCSRPAPCKLVLFL
jgi:hypothetical protein